MDAKTGSNTKTGTLSVGDQNWSVRAPHTFLISTFGRTRAVSSAFRLAAVGCGRVSTVEACPLPLMSHGRRAYPLS